MSEGMNKVILMGRLGADPELRYGGPNKTPVLNFRLATNEAWTDKEGAVHEKTAWHAVVVFGARAEAMSQRLRKGSLVFLEGYLQTHSYEKDGIKRWKTEVIAREMQAIPERARPLDALETATAEDVEASAAREADAFVKKNGARSPAPALHDDLPF